MNYNILAAHVRGMRAAVLDAIRTHCTGVHTVTDLNGTVHVYVSNTDKNADYICDLHNAEIKALEQTFNNVNVI